MRTMTATEASRNFSAVLDAAERGETIAVTRGGRTVATVTPPSPNGAAVLAAFAARERRPEIFEDFEEHYAWMRSLPERTSDLPEPAE